MTEPEQVWCRDEEGNISSRMFRATYKISDIDDASNPKYYGFLTADGQWYILEENTTTSTYRYAKGTSGYTTAWTNRADGVTVLYDYYNNTF